MERPVDVLVVARVPLSQIERDVEPRRLLAQLAHDEFHNWRVFIQANGVALAARGERFVDTLNVHDVDLINVRNVEPAPGVGCCTSP